jgi:hypothetical protein
MAERAGGLAAETGGCDWRLRLAPPAPLRGARGQFLGALGAFGCDLTQSLRSSATKSVSCTQKGIT